MIKARLSNGDLIIGISEENVRRLKIDNPMLISHNEVGDTKGDIIILYAPTDKQLIATIKKVVGDFSTDCPITLSADH